jgi:hypothetical protein
MADRDRRANRARNIQEMKMIDYTQWTTTARTYHFDHLDSDGNHLPTISKPTWSIESRLEDPNVRQALATLETSADGSSARIQTFDQPGILTIKVSALVAPNAVATKEISVAVKRHLPVTAGVLTVTQSRNTSIHH